jgi:RsiW-degrading membrane proteinase PrsW (M82 family)
MKQKLLASMRRLQKRPIPINLIVTMLLFTAFIALSIKSNGLFLKEILACSLIFGLAMVISEKNNIKNNQS